METLVTLKVSLVLRPVMMETDTKTRIRHAAHELVMQYSIRSVSMDDIANSLGMSKKTLYQYYKDKDELVEAVVNDVILTNQCTCNNDRSQAANAVHEIFMVMEMMMQMFETMNPSILFDIQKYHPKSYQKFQLHRNEFMYNIIRQNLQRGISEGLFRPEINIDVISRYRVETIFLAFNPEFQRQVKQSLLQVSEEVIIHYLFGIVSLKGYKMVLKYMEQRERTRDTKK